MAALFHQPSSFKNKNKKSKLDSFNYEKESNHCEIVVGFRIWSVQTSDSSPEIYFSKMFSLDMAKNVSIVFHVKFPPSIQLWRIQIL